MLRRKGSRSAVAVLFAYFVVLAHAGGPRLVGGTTYFDPSVTGQPIVWASGAISYFVDQGALGSTVGNATATATVAAAAAVWNAVPTAAVSIAQGGSLAEDVSGANVVATANGVTMPADIEATATAKPVAVVFDADGSVIDAFYGVGASDPDDCVDSGVLTRVDNLATSGSIVHAVILVNGLCTGTSAQLQQIQFQLIRAFGRVLGLDWSQANDAVLFGPGDPSLQQLEGWPLMRPVDLNCNQLSVECIPEPMQLRTDDIAAVSRVYPVTAANESRYPNKTLTAAATISIHGSIRFRRGQGMQGVNVIARPITPGVGLPDDRYPVASVSGFLFTGNRDNPITGANGGTSDHVSQFGSTDSALQGFYDLSGIPLPAGQTLADYQIALEPVNPLYTGSESVGPYMLGSPTPSGTMPSVTLLGLSAGMSIEQDFAIPDSASDLQPGSGGSAAEPASIPPAGEWQSRVAGIGESAWFALPVQGGRHFTVEAQSLDEDEENTASPTENKLRTVLGIWSGAEATTTPPVTATIAPFNGAAPGITSLGVDVIADGELLLGVADQRGDGRPDYSFHGRLLYASQVSPQHLPRAGGAITITGSGFRTGMLVSLGSQISATVTDITPTLILATAPPVAGPTGNLDLVLTDPATNGIAVIASGISYGDASNDTMSILASPPANLGTGVPTPFSVRVFGPDQTTPVGGVPVTFSVLDGSAVFGCGSSNCSVTTTGDGFATVAVTATAAGPTTLRASLTNGDALAAEFTATATSAIAALTPGLFLAPSATWVWMPQIQLWNGSFPAVGVPVNWSGSGAAVNVPGITSTSAQGIATTTVTLGPWAPGTSFTLTACIPNTTSCTSIPAYTVHPEAEILSFVSGADQELVSGEQPAPVVMRLLATTGQPIVGGVVNFSGIIRAWTPRCPSTGLCTSGRLLSAFSQSGTTTADGSVSVSPVLSGSIPGRLVGVATIGSSSTVPFEIDVHP
jgi:hypothetical protein